MQRAEIAGRIRHFLAEEFPNQAVELTDSTNLLGDWFVDSLGIVETVMFLETEFGIDIARADINGSNFESVATLSEFVAGRLRPTIGA